MEITASQVKELRERTGAALMACKSALQETKGDLEAAITLLRTKGLAAAAKKAGRVAAEGAVGSYIHAGCRIGVMVEVNCETDFVAKNEAFTALVKDIAMHVAAANPRFVRRDDVSGEILEKEMSIYKEQALASGKPEKVLDKIVEGKMNRFYQENCLEEQPFIKDSEHTVQEIVHNLIAQLGENIRIRRFTRFGLGEGLEKRQDDFAAEVQAQAGA
jgi:elongation factor Ts